ncbi:glycosyltransferase [Candidatus Saccharibacteria bacterium]|nr:glycosyltransferase [Candidatus Saccharibacteria bacterium]
MKTDKYNKAAAQSGNEKPLVSVVVPVYNSSKVISRCLKSIDEQSYDNIEIICVDDGSEDNSFEILKHFKTTTKKKVHIVVQKNAGVSSARNKGIKRSEGDYITFVDADDYAEPQMIETLVKGAIESHADIVKCSRYDVYNEKKIARKPIWNRKTTITKKEFYEEIYPQFYGRCRLVNAFATLISKQLLKENNICFDENMIISEDEAFSLELFDKADCFTYIPEPLYNYVKSSSGLSSNGVDLKSRIKSRIKSIEKLRYYSNKWGLPNREKYMKEKIAYLGVYTAMQTSYRNTRYTINEQKELYKSIVHDKIYKNAIQQSKKKAMIVPEKIICLLIKMRMITLSFYLSRFVGLMQRNFRSKLEKYRNA